MILTGYLCIEGASFLSFFVPSFQQRDTEVLLPVNGLK